MTRRKGESLESYRTRKRDAETDRRNHDRAAFKLERQRWREKNREAIRARHKAWRDRTKEVYNAKQRAKNKTPEYRAMRRRMRKTKQETDPNFRILQSLRARLQQALKGLVKSDRTLHLLGCDISFLRLYLEARFEPWMNWANYGEWHIDHIIPCAEFDLTKPEQQKLCFHYTNLRPLRAAENANWRKERPGVHQPEFL